MVEGQGRVGVEVGVGVGRCQRHQHATGPVAAARSGTGNKAEYNPAYSVTLTNCLFDLVSVFRCYSDGTFVGVLGCADRLIRHHRDSGYK